ncbi:hypothetical protein BDR26DRAFT_890196 [Obelidium mucronatum]|nr:hypothetical protein BDR26DRAFT_890196 [Obelidium mucronatum]
MALYKTETAPAVALPAPVDRFAAIPESHQLSLRVAEHLGSLLTRLDGHFEGRECAWLSRRLLFKYCQVFNATPFHAAIFYGLSNNEEAAVSYLQELYDSSAMD